MNVVSSECIVLRQRDFKDRDRLVTFLARDRGKLSGIARGAKVITGRGVGAYEPFTRCIVHFVDKPSGGLVNIRKVDLLPPYLYLQSDYDRFLHFTYFTELIEKSSISASDSEVFFGLLAGGLERAAAVPREALPLLRLEFELDVLTALGVQPEWKRCAACGKAIFLRKPAPEGKGEIHPRRLGTHQFDVPAGGLRCPDCREPGRARIDLAPGTLAQFAAWRAAALEARPDAKTFPPGESGSEPEAPPDLPAPPTLEAAALQELERAVTAHLVHQLERRPNSLDLLEQAERAPRPVPAAAPSPPEGDGG